VGEDEKNCGIKEPRFDNRRKRKKRVQVPLEQVTEGEEEHLPPGGGKVNRRWAE